MKFFCFLLILYLSNYGIQAEIIRVGPTQISKTIHHALAAAIDFDTILVEKGIYKEGNIIIDKPIFLIGQNFPSLDGEKKYEILSIKADDVTIQGFRVLNSGYGSLNDPGGIKIYESNHVTIKENILYNNFFGIYIQYCNKCLILNNTIVAFGEKEQEIGNGIHCWKSDSLQIIGNKISGHRDGIYFEFVTHSVIWRNISFNNIRYGLHFMFSNNDAYFTNLFRNNGAGVAVMFTSNIIMINNTFEENWGDAAYGLLLKEISDCNLSGNYFRKNTIAILFDGTNRINVERNLFELNGWGLKIQANCMDNIFKHNNFHGNTFDIGTNGTLVLNTFSQNYWDNYQGYDLDKNNIGDVPYHPLSLFSVIVENNGAAMLLYRSFMVSLMDKSEKIIPSLTPDNFIDLNPLMKSVDL